MNKMWSFVKWWSYAFGYQVINELAKGLMKELAVDTEDDIKEEELVDVTTSDDTADVSEPEWLCEQKKTSG